MPQVGTNEKPMMISSNPKGKILGDTGSWYKPENKTKYDINYDKIFGGDRNVNGEKNLRK